MLRFWLLVIILMVGVILGPLLAGHQGYVLIQTQQHNIETSITGLALMIFLLIMVVLFIENLLRYFFRGGKKTRGWFMGRKRSRAHKQTQAALLKLAEGDFQQAEKLLTRNASHAEQPVVNYLLAAEAAQQNGDLGQMQHYLQCAEQNAKGETLPVEITRVRLQLAQGEYNAACRTVDTLLSAAPRHPEVLRMAVLAYQRGQQAASILEILPSLRKLHLYEENKLQDLQQQAYLDLMQRAEKEQGSEGLKNWWAQQSRKVRQNGVLQQALLERLLQQGDAQTAQKILLGCLKKHYDARLLPFISRLNAVDTQPIIKLLRRIIKQQGETPELKQALDRLEPTQSS